jgi:N6-adenosine-specific RNA methylase IME4
MDFAALRAARLALRDGLSRRASQLAAAVPDPVCDAVLAALGGTQGVDGAALDTRGVSSAGAAGPQATSHAQQDAVAAMVAVVAALLVPLCSGFEAEDSAALHKRLLASSHGEQYAQLGGQAALLPALRRLEEAGAVEVEEFSQRGEVRVMLLHLDATRLVAEAASGTAAAPMQLDATGGRQPPEPRSGGRRRPRDGEEREQDLDALLSAPTFKERQARAEGAELAALLNRPTAKEAAAAERFRSVGGSAVKEYCPKLTRDACRRSRGGGSACSGLHFVRLMLAHTDLSLGDCSFLDTCRHMRTCKYVHYASDPADAAQGGRDGGAPGGGDAATAGPLRPVAGIPDALQACPEAQWINCDVRSFDLGVLGQFGVVMADPPWDIHMDLPYGTMADDEMRRMPVGCLQPDGGVLFLWVTGRAMELGRECLGLWGYRQVQELVWVKSNQLQRLIRTGRTGHWLNHSKEHCLVGVKGKAGGGGGSGGGVNRHIDCDVLVAEVRETSRKPDEVYALLERLSPGTRKLEIFGREHNCRPHWLTLGNQLPGVRLADESLRRRFLARYPEREGELTLTTA